MNKLLLALLVLLLNVSWLKAEDLDAQQIMMQVDKVKRVDDQIATLTFYFQTPGQPDQKATYTMVWKNMYGEDGYDNKAMYFTVEPIEKRGIAYLGWLRATGSDKLDDEWVYLPELRMTRRLAYRDHEHSHDDDEYGLSLLKREHLEPRPAHLDTHEIVGAEEMFNGKAHYLIASKPKHSHHDKAHNSTGKVVRWVDKEHHIITRQQFFDIHDKLTLDMLIEWQQLQGYWLWKQLEATDSKGQRKTVMTITNMKINSGLKDRDFHKRMLEKGWRF